MSVPARNRVAARVVVVDDDDAVRESLGFLLAAHKFETQLYGCGEDALAAQEQRDVDCILLDLDLPGIDGLEVMACLRSEMPGVPVLLMTALQTGQLKKAAQSAGAAALLDKPVKDGALIEAINTAINTPEHTKANISGPATVPQ